MLNGECIDNKKIEGPLVADLSVANNRIRTVASTLLVSGELADGSRVRAAMQEIFGLMERLCSKTKTKQNRKIEAEEKCETSLSERVYL
jgi:hypothetical protein